MLYVSVSVCFVLVYLYHGVTLWLIGRQEVTLIRGVLVETNACLRAHFSHFLFKFK